MTKITEILKMLFIIFLWLGAYSLSLELIKAYAAKEKNCKIDMQDFIPSVENSIKSEFANCGKVCGKEN